MPLAIWVDTHTCTCTFYVYHMLNYPSLKVIFYEHVEINVGQFGIKKERHWGENKMKVSSQLCGLGNLEINY